LGSAVLAAGANADDFRTADLGTPAPGEAGRTMKIDASTKYVNAEHLEVVTIRNQQGQGFCWRFDTLHASTGFPLSNIAPLDFDAGDTWVYVRPRHDGLGN